MIKFVIGGGVVGEYVRDSSIDYDVPLDFGLAGENVRRISLEALRDAGT
jgi:hypothetical protein